MTQQAAAELPKSYRPADSEPQVRARWEASRAFHADPNAGGEPFCILIPPPNVTAALHLGHAFNNTLQDVLTRYHRMRGFNTLWMPGTDHAGISTQAVVEKRLLLQGKRRSDFTREQFIEKVQAWKDEYEATIIEQLKAMGASCDFERTRFTMDEVCAKAVREAFFRLFKDGLIYRGKRLVNWDPVTQTALADDEVEMEEVQGHMWYLRYPIIEDHAFQAGAKRSAAPGRPEYVTVATTRPETMLGDTAVAMNPRDPRAAQFVGKKVRLPIVNREIPIIADDYVVMPAQYGGDPNDSKAQIATGFLKVTPAHDPNDWEIGQRHNLPVVNIFAPDATISDKHGWTDVSKDAQPLVGLAREEAREKIVQWFKAHNLLEDVKPYTHSVGHSYRSHVPIEPYLSDQWYVKVTDDRMRGEALRAMAAEQFENEADPDSRVATRPRAQPAGAARASSHPRSRSDPAGGNREMARHAASREGDGELRFFPARYARTFQLWHENLRDWCISRQLWWGHRIPVWSRHYDSFNQWKGIGLTTNSAAYQDELSDRLWSLEENHDQVSMHFVADDDATRTPLNSAPDQSGFTVYVCIRDSTNEHPGTYESGIIELMERMGFSQDPDVLDTWFSSGLWPISTMGWPEPQVFPDQIPEGSALLNTFNPSTVLLTAREIITLWVSRMVMFNRYFRDGKLPFRHVYVHAMIQDGHGQKMSKSLGNGVDPRDIIHSHGADALRFIMTKIATATQDVRLPVDMVCPREGCEEAFEPKQITSSAGYRVAAPEQTCPKCKRKMISGYGAASGIANPTKNVPLARNTSRRFDEGRNFANKIWNAARFALSNLPKSRHEGTEARRHEGDDLRALDLALVDKWILTRLHRTVHAVEDALADYQFNAYADAMYDFVWRDFCDWYLEAIKPTVKSKLAQQQVLRTALNAIMRLLHPIMPFVTEALWPSIAASGEAGLEGIKLRTSDLLATAPWPDIKCTVDDPQALAAFERVQRLTDSIRQIRAERQVPPKRKITLLASPQAVEVINSAPGVLESLATIESVQPNRGPRPGGAVPLMFEGSELLLTGLVDEVDISAERARLMKLVAEKERAISGFTAKLSNEGYLSKAPPEKVEETRKLLAQAQADLAAAQKGLQSLT